MTKRHCTLAATVFVAFLLLSSNACAVNGGSGVAGPGNFTVTDQAGRQVEVGGAARRIVSGYYISSSVCIALGLSDRLAGIEARADSRPIYALSKPELLDLPSVGTAKDFSIEACLDLKPDIVILPYRLRDAADILEEMGVPAILVSPEGYPEMMEMIALIGQAAGDADRAERLIAWCERTRAEVAELTAGIPARPSVYMCGVGSWLATAPSGMYQASLIEIAGGRNTAGDIGGTGWIEVSYELLLAINPDVMVIPSEAGYGKQDILSDLPLSRLSAVTSGRVYQMPSAFEAWDSPVPASMLGAKWLLSVLHGDIYPIETLLQDAADFYREFYDIEIGTSLIDK